MNEIKITLNDVSTAATSIRMLNASLDDTLNEISRSMNELSAVWRGNAGETIVNNFHKFANKFIDESETIEEYAKFLDYTVSSYDSLESTLSANASNFE